MTTTVAPPSIAKQIAALHRMSPSELRDTYAEVFGELSRSGNKTFLIKRIAWRIQSLAEGSISERAQRRAKELAANCDVRLNPPAPRASAAPPPRLEADLPHDRDPRLPAPGTIISRKYRGGVIHVNVLKDGFEYEGEHFRSLTAVARRVTGANWNGFHFFGLESKA